MIKHIIWDLDGTLINSEPEIIYYLKQAVEHAGIYKAQKKCEFRIGPTLEKVISAAYQDVTNEQMMLAINNFRALYDNCGFSETIPFDGIVELLDALSGIKHHIVTNKPEFATMQVIKKIRWENRFESIRSPYMTDGVYVSKAKMMRAMLDEFGATPEEVISIGDMATDAIAAHANNLYVIGVTWGTGLKEELIPVCDKIVDTVLELKKFLAERIDG